MSFRTLAVFTLFLFAIALVNAPPVEACDTGGVQPGNPTFSFTQAQPVYQTQAFVAAPVVTQQFAVQQFAVQPQVQHFAVQQQAFAVHQPQAVVLQNVVRQPRRQVTRSSTVTRTGGILGFRN